MFFPEGAYGPTNNCVGIGQVLRERGARVVFVVEESFAGTLEKRGFEEALMRLTPPPEEPEVPGQFWKDFIRETAPEFRKPTVEQLSTFLRPTWQAIVDGARHVEPRLREIVDDLRPDVIVEDNVQAFPAIVASGRPWVRIVSCNPLEVRDPGIPPVFSGYPAGDRAGWAEFRDEFRRTHGDLWGEFDAFVRDAGAPPLPELEFIHESPWLNLYLYPEEADYGRSRTLAQTWHRLDSCVREPEAPFELPDRLAGDVDRDGDGDGDGALIYFSLGSLGSADVDLMDRLIAILAETPHRYVVSKGPQAELVELADNMWGEELVPQPAILPRVDLVITHGGNNTVTEAFHNGKPMVVLPLFWDQYDNAQRVDELGYGVRVAPYTCSAEELTGAIDGLLADSDLRRGMKMIGEEIRSRDGRTKAADLLEQLARTGEPVTA
ncbi:MAG: glycosyl transferase [Actinobacteria bacterium]|nr:glycosyl transferase [Actinomycetota bacterium]